jgi:hypothetical protein
VSSQEPIGNVSIDGRLRTKVIAVLISPMGTTDDNAVREAVRRMILRGLPVERDLPAGPKPIRPFDVMKPERFVLRELTRKPALRLKKG